MFSGHQWNSYVENLVKGHKPMTKLQMLIINSRIKCLSLVYYFADLAAFFKDKLKSDFCYIAVDKIC